MTSADFLKKSAPEILFELERGGRLVSYQYVISLVLVTFRRNAPLQYVAPGESATTKGLPWTLLTLLLGWWGFPFGLVYTPMVLYKNLKGGTDVTQAFLQSLRPQS